MSTRNFVIARNEEEARTMADSDGGSFYGAGLETVEQAQQNLENIKGLTQYFPPNHGGTDYQIYRIIRQVVLVDLTEHAQALRDPKDDEPTSNDRVLVGTNSPR